MQIAEQSGKKKKHDLYLAKNPEDFKRRAAAIGLDVVETVSRCLVDSSRIAEIGILLVGSISEGTGNSESDLDLMVLAPSHDLFLHDKNDVNVASRVSDEKLRYISGVELNIEIFSRDRLEGVINDLLELAPALYDPRDLNFIPMLGLEEKQFLHRLKNGWALNCHEAAVQWRDEFMVEILPIYLCVRDYFESIEYLEDAVSALTGPLWGATIMGRKCLEFALYSLFDMAGYTSQSKKWIIHWRDQLFRKGQDTTLIDQTAALLLRGADASRDEEVRFIEDIKHVLKGIRRHLDQDIAIERALRYLDDEIFHIGLE